jgi:glyoxylase-like metal-dependent hydrolase (beta-lactamase superfamily II)
VYLIPDPRSRTKILVCLLATVNLVEQSKRKNVEHQKNTMQDSITFGNVTITRVLEWAGPLRAATEIIPDSSDVDWQANESLLSPDFWNPATNAYHCHVQSWVIRSDGKTIVVDTGVGNDRERPQIPQFDRLRTGFLNTLRRAGVQPADVDIVVNTHIHADHVGWNTQRHDNDWIPTFPNARYLIPRPDYEYFEPANEYRRPPAITAADQLRRRGNQLLFADSISPIDHGGLAELWENSYRIDANLVLEPAPGHTPGSCVLWLSSGTAHFSGHSAAEIRRDGTTFAISAWAPFSTTSP